MGFDSMFDDLFFSCELGHMKPEPVFFEAVARKLNSAPAELHFWDDSLAYIDAAKRAGWNGHHFVDFEAFETDVQR